MFNGKKEVAIVDVESVQDIATGDREKKVTKGKIVVAKVDLVGVQVQQLGQAQGMNLSYAVEIPRYQYDQEKYVFFDDQLYVIVHMTKAKSPTNMLLNVAKLKEKEIADAIRTWKAGGTT